MSRWLPVVAVLLLAIGVFIAILIVNPHCDSGYHYEYRGKYTYCVED